MLKWALLCLAVAVAAAFAGSEGFDGPTLGAAKVLCFAALALFVVLVGVSGVSRRAEP